MSTEAMKQSLSDLIEIRDVLQLENENIYGAISDTIWMPYGNETLFEFIDSCIEKQRKVIVDKEKQKYVSYVQHYRKIFRNILNKSRPRH